MKNNKIKITESALQQIISKSISKVLNESVNEKEPFHIYNLMSNMTCDLGYRITKIRDKVINGQEITKDEIESIYEFAWEIHDYIDGIYGNECLKDECY